MKLRHVALALFLSPLYAQPLPPPQIDLSPRANLPPRLYQELRGEVGGHNSLDRVAEQVDQMDRRTTAHLETIQQQYVYLMERQRVMLEQMTILVDLNKQVIIGAERIAAIEHRITGLEGRIQHHEDADASNPRTVAMLETKVDVITRIALWLLGGVGSLVMGAIVFLAKRRISAILKREH